MALGPIPILESVSPLARPTLPLHLTLTDSPVLLDNAQANAPQTQTSTLTTEVTTANQSVQPAHSQTPMTENAKPAAYQNSSTI